MLRRPLALQKPHPTNPLAGLDSKLGSEEAEGPLEWPIHEDVDHEHPESQADRPRNGVLPREPAFLPSPSGIGSPINIWGSDIVNPLAIGMLNLPHDRNPPHFFS